MKRAIVLVMDGCGVGEAPDANHFGDFDHPNTIRHVWEANPGLDLPFLQNAGLLDIAGIPNQSPTQKLGAHYGKMEEQSQGKDSVTGHWEMMGIVTEVPFPTYPHGFPSNLVEEFESKIGTKILGNKPASGTEIIQELGPEHERTGYPIVYTSADSVFQIACHESVVPVERLYELCMVAREVCVKPNNLERVIARPFIGKSGSYIRTGNRRDFPLEPPKNFIDQYNLEFGGVYGIGVVPELFNHRGFIPVERTHNNREHEQALLHATGLSYPFIFANFEDFDMLYGHRNNPQGFANALVQLDQFLSNFWKLLTPNDLLILTADHGNDPTTPPTDHSREYVPFCALNKNFENENLGVIKGMSQVSKAVADWIGSSPSTKL